MSTLTSAEATPVPASTGYITLRFARTRASVRLKTRVLVVTALAAAAMAAASAYSLTLGLTDIPLIDALRTAIGRGDGTYDFVIQTLRLPRLLVAMLAGYAFAVSGGIFQGIVRNPLVSPDIVGVNAGAVALGVFWIVTARPPGFIPLAAFAGASIAAIAVYVLSWKRGISPGRLVLVGIGMNVLFIGFTRFLFIRFSVERTQTAVQWSTGSVYASNWNNVRTIAIAIALLLPLAFLLSRGLRVLQLGDDTAKALGLSVETSRLLLLLTGTGLAAAAVAAAGPIGFVALMTPHIARMLAGPTSAGILALSGFLGASLVIISDMVAQYAFPVSIPVGGVTAAVGAPYFLYLLRRERHTL